MVTVHDLILVRHEEAVGNCAMVRSKFLGDESGFTDAFRATSSNAWCLTVRGVERCAALRAWLKATVPAMDGFQLEVSPSLRALETANRILPGFIWKTNELVRGRLWGGIECIPWSEWPAFCKVRGHDELPSGFHQTYPNGEAMIEVWKRTKDFITALERSTFVVTHGEVLLMARMLLERVPESEYHQLECNGNHVRNGQVVWYSKRDPESGRLSEEFTYRRMWFDATDTRWVTIRA